MKNRILIFALLVSIGGLLLLGGCQKHDAQETIDTTLPKSFTDQFSSKNVVEVTFDNFLVTNASLIEQWDNFLKTNNVHISNYTVDVYDTQGNYLFAGGATFGNEENNFLFNILANSVNLYSENTKQRFAELESKEKESNLNVEEKTALAAFRQQEKMNPSGNQVAKLRSLILILSRSSIDALNNLVNSSKGSSVDFLEKLKLKLNQSENRDNVAWTPDSGTEYTYQYSTTKRDLYNVFQWNVKPMGEWYTYEHDCFLYYYNSDGTYLTRNQNSLGFPICSWNSNMPYAYLDTRFLDNTGFEGNANEIQYTVGCGNSNSLAKNVTYSTLMRMDYGDVGTDKIKVMPQAGSQIPIGCTSTWCSYGFAHVKVVSFPSGNNINVPGTNAWTY